MKFVRTVLFTVNTLSRYSLHYAGAEMCGGDTRRARSDAYRHLKNLSSDVVQAQIATMRAGRQISAPAQDRP